MAMPNFLPLRQLNTKFLGLDFSFSSALHLLENSNPNQSQPFSCPVVVDLHSVVHGLLSGSRCGFIGIPDRDRVAGIGDSIFGFVDTLPPLFVHPVSGLGVEIVSAHISNVDGNALLVGFESN